jgi:hypothetical protein
VRVYGLVNVPLRKLVDVYSTEAEAAAAREQVLADEPGWAADLAVHPLELEVEEDGVRLRTSEAGLLDLSYREAATERGSVRARLSAVRGRSRTRRREA